MYFYAVVGNPVQHSQSPRIHRLFADQTQQSLTYSAILVEQAEQLASVLHDFQSKQGHGLNITAPFKELAYTLVDRVSPYAARAKAINTIRFDADGKRFGDNTDGVGLVRDLTINQKMQLANKSVLLLGAGGAVRGVLEAVLNENPAALTLTNRTYEKALLLASELPYANKVRVLPWAGLAGRAFDVIINGTSAALHDEDFILPADILNPGAFCYDMTYGVGVTPFLRWASRQSRVRYSDGLGMLVEQAAESFYIWRQIRPNTQVVLALLRT